MGLFVDTKTAFASVIRALSLPVQDDHTRKTVYEDRLVSSGFSRDEARDKVRQAEDAHSRWGGGKRTPS